MPHTSKKYRKQNANEQKGRNNRTIMIAAIAVIAIIAVAGGYYVYSSAKTTTTSSTVTTSATGTQSSSVTTTSAASSQSGLIYAKLDTSQGTFEVELFQNVTPKTVANFVNLADSGFYNNLVWHRIVAGFVIQTGDNSTRNGEGSPCSWGSGGSGVQIPFESSSLPNDVGYLGMASTAAGQGGTSQFYINLANNTDLNGNYAVFGKVISGMNVVDAIGNLPTQSCSGGGTPPSDPADAMLISVTIQNSP